MGRTFTKRGSHSDKLATLARSVCRTPDSSASEEGEE